MNSSSQPLAESNHILGSSSTSGHRSWQEHDSWHFCGPVIAPWEVQWVFGSALLNEFSTWLSAFMEKLKLDSHWARTHTHTGLKMPQGDMNYSLWDARFVGCSPHFMHTLTIKDQLYKLGTQAKPFKNQRQFCSMFTSAATTILLKTTKTAGR